MDYLLRDSHHTGVSYGKFDHYRLVDTLRILPSPVEESSPAIGVEEGGLHSAEALLLARYFMFTQVYFHPIRRIYDKHLIDFLVAHYGQGGFPIETQKFLDTTDIEIMTAMGNAAKDSNLAGHDPAKRIVDRHHYRLVYSLNLKDYQINTEPGKAIYQALCEQYDHNLIRHDSSTEKGGVFDFPVLERDSRVNSSLVASQLLGIIPRVAVDYVFAASEIFGDVREWLKNNREDILSSPVEEEE